jgi:hypothetical protein
VGFEDIGGDGRELWNGEFVGIWIGLFFGLAGHLKECFRCCATFQNSNHCSTCSFRKYLDYVKCSYLRVVHSAIQHTVLLHSTHFYI